MQRIILILVVLAVLLGGGYYLYSKKTPGIPPEEQAMLEQEQAAIEAEDIRTVSSSNTVNTIDAELESTELDTLDKEFADIESEIDDALSGL